LVKVGVKDGNIDLVFEELPKVRIGNKKPPLLTAK